MGLQMSCLLNAFLVVQFISLVITTQGPPLRFIPTGNIALGQRALFHCSVDSSSMSISWKIDGKFLTDGDVADKIEYYNGAGTPNSTLALKGIRDNNNTLVICIASGSFSGGPYSTSFGAVVKIQGLLDPVQNLRGAITKDCCLHITWTPPFSLSGVPVLGFNLNLSLPTGKEVIESFLSSYSYRQCLKSTIGEYMVAVAGLNAVGQGVTTFTNFRASGIVNGSLLQVNSKQLLVSCTFSDDQELSWPVEGCYVVVNCTDNNFQYETYLVRSSLTSVVTKQTNVLFSCSANAYFYNVECSNSMLLHKPVIVRRGISIVKYESMLMSSLRSEMPSSNDTTGSNSSTSAIFIIVSVATVVASILIGVIICLALVLIYECWKKGRCRTSRKVESSQIEVAPPADDTSVHGTNPLALLPTTTQTALYLDIHAKEIDPLLTHEQLMSFLTFPSVASKWYNIGVSLCVPSPQLDDISMLFQDNVTCMSETFREWMMRKTVPFTWEMLLQALRSETVEEYELAHHLQIHLQQIYRRQSSQPSTPLSSQGGAINDTMFVDDPEGYENLKASAITTNRSVAYRMPQ